MKVIFVTGTPGVGKTKVARRLAERLDAKYVDLGRLAIRSGLQLGLDSLRRTRVVNIRKLGEFLLKKSNCALKVADGHLLVKIPSTNVKSVLVLRCRPQELFRRLKKKGWHQRKMVENLWAELLDSCLTEAVDLYGRPKVIEVDTTGKSITKVVDEIRVLLSKRPRRWQRAVNWIDPMDGNGTLGWLMRLEAKLH